jgi:hypothetical protein
LLFYVQAINDCSMLSKHSNMSVESALSLAEAIIFTATHIVVGITTADPSREDFLETILSLLLRLVTVTAITHLDQR